MVPRVAAFEGIDVERARETKDEAEAVIRPMVEALVGYEGRPDLAAADGRFVSITLFESKHARRGEATFDEEMPRRLGEIFSSWEGRRVSVDLFEVVTGTR